MSHLLHNMQADVLLGSQHVNNSLGASVSNGLHRGTPTAHIAVSVCLLGWCPAHRSRGPVLLAKGTVISFSRTNQFMQ